MCGSPRSALDSAGFANKGSRRGKPRRWRLLLTAMALRPGVAFAKVASFVVCPLRRHAAFIVCCTGAADRCPKD